LFVVTRPYGIVTSSSRPAPAQVPRPARSTPPRRRGAGRR
jgi:hypothetical protein